MSMFDQQKVNHRFHACLTRPFSPQILHIRLVLYSKLLVIMAALLLSNINISCKYVSE